MQLPKRLTSGLLMAFLACAIVGQTAQKKRSAAPPTKVVPTQIPTPQPTAPPTMTPTPEVWQTEPTSYRGVDFGTSYEEVRKKKNLLTFCTPAGSKPAPSRACIGGNTIGDTYVDEAWNFQDDRLAGVAFTFKTTGYNTLREVFVEKYGRPHSVDEDDVTTMMGVHGKNETLWWRGKIVTVMLERFAGNINEGRASILTNAFVEQRMKEAQEKKEKAKKAF